MPHLGAYTYVVQSKPFRNVLRGVGKKNPMEVQMFQSSDVGILEEFFPAGGYVVGFCDHFEEEEDLDLDRLAKEADDYFSSHRPTQEELDAELRPSLYERLTDEVGPWTHTTRRFGWEWQEAGAHGVAEAGWWWRLADEWDVGYEGSGGIDEHDRWQAEFEGHLQLQDAIEKLERLVESAVIHDSIEWTSDDRFEFFSRVYAWVQKSRASVVATNASRFWDRLNASRARCAETKLWAHVLLTKGQANCLNDLIRLKCGWRI